MMLPRFTAALLLGLAAHAAAIPEPIYDDEFDSVVLEYKPTMVPLPVLTAAKSAPLADQYSDLLQKTCKAAKSRVPVLDAGAAKAFQAAYSAFTGTGSEDGVIKAAGVLLADKDVQAFLTAADSTAAGGADADLILCAVLVQATPAGLANYTAQSGQNQAVVDALLADTLLMRAMLVAGGASNGDPVPEISAPRQYGPAASIYAAVTKASTVLPPWPATKTAAAAAAATPYWDDRSQAKTAVLARLALAVATELSVPKALRFKQTATPPWGPDNAGETAVNPVNRFLHYEAAYLAGDLDPAFEVTTAFEMRHTVNADASDSDLAWMRLTMGFYGPNYIAMNYSVGSDWRYGESVHHDVAYVHTHCPQPNYTLVCSGHYSMIPAKGGICGFRAFWTRITRKAFGIPTWGATHSGHAAMTSWNPQGWVIMLAGKEWSQGRWGAVGGDDWHLEAQARELRPQYQQVLRGHWAARARGDAPAGRSWGCDYGGHGNCNGYGAGGLWSALMLYAKKAAVAAVTLPNGSVNIPVRPVGPSSVPTKVDALLAKWNTDVPTPAASTGTDGTITVPAAAFAPAPKTTAGVSVFKSYVADPTATQLLHPGGDYYNPESAALVYDVTTAKAGTYYLTVNHSSWHTDQDLVLSVNGQAVGNVPVFFTIGYWNTTQPVAVTLAAGANTLTLTRLSTSPMAIKELKLHTSKPSVPAPPGGGFTPVPIAPPPAASQFVLEPPSTSCELQGIPNVPENLCKAACLLVANRTYTGSRPHFTNVAGCFAIMEGQYKTNCNFNADTSVECKPPCGSPGDAFGELCLTKKVAAALRAQGHAV